MHNLRLNYLLSVVLDTFRSGFFDTTKIGNAQFDIEWYIILTSSSCLISWSLQSQYLGVWNKVYML